MSHDRSILPAPVLPSLAEAEPGGAEGEPRRAFVSRAGHKLEAGLVAFGIDVKGRVCADLGANVGGFTDCLLRYGAAKVYAVDTAYGVLAWVLRKDPRVVVRDRTNALHVQLPEAVGLVAVDVGWTKQEKVLPQVWRLLAGEPSGGSAAQEEGPSQCDVLTLIKPHYESALARTQRGVLTPAQSEEVLWEVVGRIEAMRMEGVAGGGGEDEKSEDGRGVGGGWEVKGVVRSPLEGQKGNVEYVAWLRPRLD